MIDYAFVDRGDRFVLALRHANLPGSWLLDYKKNETITLKKFDRNAGDGSALATVSNLNQRMRGSGQLIEHHVETSVETIFKKIPLIRPFMTRTESFDFWSGGDDVRRDLEQMFDVMFYADTQSEGCSFNHTIIRRDQLSFEPGESNPYRVFGFQLAEFKTLLHADAAEKRMIAVAKQATAQTQLIAARSEQDPNWGTW